LTTALDLITGAFNAARVYAPGEILLAPDESQGFSLLNQLIDSWSNESLTCFAIVEQSGVPVVGQTAYTIGLDPTADFNMTRPIRLITGPGAAYLLDTNNNRYPVQVVAKDEWNLIWNLRSVTSNLPNTIYYDPQFPLGIINIYPLPNTTGVTLFWDSYLQLTDFPSVNGLVSLPPGYERAIQQNLALELEPYYPTAVITQQLMRQAAESKGNVKRSNVRSVTALYDRALMKGGGRPYNVYSDSNR
jgi:hypothetical protein